MGLGVGHDGLGGDAVHQLGAAADAWEARVLVVLVHLVVRLRARARAYG